MTNIDNELKSISLSFTREEIRDLNTVLEWVTDQKLPFLSEEFSEIKWKVRRAHINGCFTHNVIMGSFEISLNETMTICPDCAPDEFRNLVKKNYKCLRAPTKFGIPMTDEYRIILEEIVGEMEEE